MGYTGTMPAIRNHNDNSVPAANTNGKKIEVFVWVVIKLLKAWVEWKC